MADLMTMIRDFLLEQADLAEDCRFGDDCRHPVDHPLRDASGALAAFTCYNPRAFEAGLAAFIERCYQAEQEAIRRAIEQQSAAYDAWRTSPAGQEAFRRYLEDGIAILRGDVPPEELRRMVGS